MPFLSGLQHKYPHKKSNNMSNRVWLIPNCRMSENAKKVQAHQFVSTMKQMGWCGIQ